MIKNPKYQKVLRIAKKVLLLLAWIGMLGGLIFALAFVNKQEQELTCKKVNVSVYPLDVRFFNRQRVLEVLRHSIGQNRKLIGLPMKEIDIAKFERELTKQIHIEKAHVFMDMHGELNIKVTQRTPILRVIRYDGNHYYLDRNGYKIPVSEYFTAHVPIANGNIFERYEKGDTVYSFVGNQLYNMASYVDKDPFLKAFIEQIFVRADNELVLVPKLGRAYFVFGTTENLEEKFEKMLVFCREGLNRIGWNKYKSVDLRFKGQVIGKK